MVLEIWEDVLWKSWYEKLSITDAELEVFHIHVNMYTCMDAYHIWAYRAVENSGSSRKALSESKKI